MKNYEKYADKIREYNSLSFCDDFIKPYILKSDDCFNNCSKCGMVQVLWLLEDYEEPEIDWNEVKVDTPILVKNYVSDKWLKKHFAKYENGIVYAWTGGKTSWTEDCATSWNYAKLAESEDSK